MDTRFPPLIERIKVPLYPVWKEFLIACKASLGNRSGERLDIFLESYYGANKQQIILANKGSSAFYLFLKAYAASQNSLVKVAIPAFFCPEVCQAILRAGCIPVFLDLTTSFMFDEKSIFFALRNGCQVIVWPQLFGTREPCKRMVEMIKNSPLIIVNDEAQSFPDFGYRPLFEPDISLFSFGSSKKIGGVGGGGLCVHNLELLKNIKIDKPDCHTNFNFFPHISSILKKTGRNLSYSIARKLNLCSQLEKNLDVLLEKKPFAYAEMAVNELSSYQKSVNYAAIESMHENFDIMLSETEDLKLEVKETLGARSLDYIQEIPYPSIFALNCSTTQQRAARYQLSSFFSRQKIQTTWYYFPLSHLSFLKHYPCEELKFTLTLAESILIFPWHWKHTTKQRKFLKRGLRCYCD